MFLACSIFTWIFLHRWSQRNNKGPKTWPLVGAAIEQLMNYDRMHDWLVNYLSKSSTVVVPMPFTTYTYIADPTNVEHVLKTNFANYPKVFIFICTFIFFNKNSHSLIYEHRPKHAGFYLLSRFPLFDIGIKFLIFFLGF